MTHVHKPILGRRFDDHCSGGFSVYCLGGSICGEEQTKVRSNMKLNILGTEYTVTVKKYEEDEYFKRGDCNGYCSQSLKEIVVCDMATYPGWEHETQEVIDIQKKATLRHEIVHAFFNESGLSCNSSQTDAWARNEEMVDWFAFQGPKIYKVWQEAGAL